VAGCGSTNCFALFLRMHFSEKSRQLQLAGLWLWCGCEKHQVLNTSNTMLGLNIRECIEEDASQSYDNLRFEISIPPIFSLHTATTVSLPRVHICPKSYRPTDQLKHRRSCTCSLSSHVALYGWVASCAAPCAAAARPCVGTTACLPGDG
jgi:hypothetical protein